MVGKPAPQKSSPPATDPSQKPAAPVPSSGTESRGPAPLNRNSPSVSTVDSMTAVHNGGRDQRTRRRSTAKSEKSESRLVSLDAFRGFIMMLLAANGFGLLAFSRIDESSPVWTIHNRDLWQRIGFHFDHPAWISSFDYFKVSFWDLIQPSFMFMVGVAMPFSNKRRESQQHGIVSRGFHALTRSVVLVLMGVFLYSMGHERTNWIFPNVLCQIGLGYFFAWILMNLGLRLQYTALVAILVGYWAFFYFNPPPADFDYAAVNANPEKGEVLEGKFAPWSKNANAATFFDDWLLPRLRTIPEPTADTQPAATVQSVRDWQVVSMPLQESALPENSQATDELEAPLPNPDSVPVPSTEAAEAPQPEAPQPEAPTIDSSEDLNESKLIETPDAASLGDNVAEPDLPAQPGWFRRWFLSNTEPYKVNGGGYATLNFVPSIATTLLGILCGQLLLNPDRSRWAKLGLLILAAAACLALGILADQTICPVVKRIWTPSWVLFSGGYVIGMLALFYLLFDIAPLRILAFPLVVVGVNSILVYMMGQTISGWMRESIIKVHLAGMIEGLFGPKALDPLWYGPITLPTTVFLLYWLFLLWLYRQRIFLRL